jgi:hypothetical protein
MKGEKPGNITAFVEVSLHYYRRDIKNEIKWEVRCQE